MKNGSGNVLINEICLSDLSMQVLQYTVFRQCLLDSEGCDTGGGVGQAPSLSLQVITVCYTVDCYRVDSRVDKIINVHYQNTEELSNCLH